LDSQGTLAIMADPPMLDAEPEDAYDAGDPSAARLNVLHLVVAALEQAPEDARRRFRIRDALRLLATIRHHRREVRRLRERLEAL
jgi:hypothetical protein